MPKQSAGILLYRQTAAGPEVLLVHPGGPFWAKKDDGAWSIPKGLYEQGEDALAAAKREFQEETGCIPSGDFVSLGEFRYASGKTIAAWAVEGDFDLANFTSNTFTMEWPPRSGKMTEFPEADRAAWFGVAEAERKMVEGQVPIIAALLAHLNDDWRHSDD